MTHLVFSFVFILRRIIIKILKILLNPVIRIEQIGLRFCLRVELGHQNIKKGKPSHEQNNENRLDCTRTKDKLEDGIKK